MKTKERMVKPVSGCGPEDNLAKVAATMWDERCGALPVVDYDGRVIGMITDRDICIALGTRNVRASDVQVKDVAAPRVFTCLDRDDVSQALLTMVSQNVRRLPVVTDGGNLVGVISIDDFLMPTETGVFSIDVLEALKTIVENRKRGQVHEKTGVLAAHG
jgi:CBS domain-containing protein